MTLDLDPRCYLAKGGGSLVFQHPERPDWLIKVFRPKRSPNRWRRLRPMRRKYGRMHEWMLEYDHYIRTLHRIGHCPDYLPRMFGFADTSLGPGQVVEKVTDAGSPEMARTVRQYIAEGGEWPPLERAIERFFDQVGRDRVVFWDLSPSNLCVVADRAGRPVRLVAVDGLGERTLIPLRSSVGWARAIWHAQSRRRFLAEARRAHAAIHGAPTPALG